MLSYFLPAHEKPFAERTDAENETIREWRVRLNWYSALRRANIAPQFTEDSAKAFLGEVVKQGGQAIDIFRLCKNTVDDWPRAPWWTSLISAFATGGDQ